MSVYLKIIIFFFDITFNKFNVKIYAIFQTIIFIFHLWFNIRILRNNENVLLSRTPSHNQIFYIDLRGLIKLYTIFKIVKLLNTQNQ